MIGTTSRANVELNDIQGNILRPYDYPHAMHTLVRVDDGAAARAWLGRLPVTSAEPWTGPKPEATCNVAFTYAGLAALGVPANLLATFADAFRRGMADRAGILGDVGQSAPAKWDAGLGTGQAGILVSQHSRRPGRLADVVEELHDELAYRGIGTVVHAQPADKLHRRTHDDLFSHEHFGFADGFAQPAVAGVDNPAASQKTRTRFGRRVPLGTGEFIFGYRDSDGHLPDAPAPPLHRNGTYMVYRKLAQDVAGFRAFVDRAAHATGHSSDLVAAKIVGRWCNGSPLVLAPDGPDHALAIDQRRVNDFDYRHDKDGARCPLGAHVRRTNPRDSLAFGYARTTRHHIIRRGMPYGPALPPGAPAGGPDRGLVFVCFNTDIERQFEFIQQRWCNDGDPFGLGNDTDALIGVRPGSGKMTLNGRPPTFLSDLPDFVTTRGGEYLFVPGKQALAALAQGVVA